MSIHNHTKFTIHGHEVTVYICREMGHESLYVDFPDDLRVSVFQDGHYRNEYHGETTSLIIDPVRFMKLPIEDTKLQCKLCGKELNSLGACSSCISSSN